MGPVNKCCNPLNKNKHKNIQKNIVFITAKRASAFKKFIGCFMCNSCERHIYKGKKSTLSPRELCENEFPNVNELELVNDDVEDNENTDPSYQCEVVDNQLKVDRINKLLFEVGEPPVKIKRLSSENECKKVIKAAISILGNKNDSSDDSVNQTKNQINHFKVAFDQKISRSDKIQVLTTLPLEWSTKMIRREFQVSRRMVRCAKKIREQSGFASQPPVKEGKRLHTLTQERIKNFYLCDDVSRMMPGMKDYVSVVENGEKQHKQKRLLLFNIQDLHTKFRKAFPDEKIGLTKFQALRPRECISAGPSGTHNVCVCKIHQNVKLQLTGLKNELKRKGCVFSESYTDLIKSSVCNNSTSSCFFSDCSNCPGVNYIIDKLKLLLDNFEIIKITYSQWISTDR